MVATVSYRWTSSSSAIDSNTSSRPKGYITSRLGGKGINWCQTCPIPIGIGRAGIFCPRDGLGMSSRRMGGDASWF